MIIVSDTFTADQFSELAASASALINELVKRGFRPTPSETNCGIRPYMEVFESFFE